MVKLFGEHAVVHNRTALAAAVSVFASASIERNGGSDLVIYLNDYGGKSVSLSRGMLENIYDAYSSRESIEGYRQKVSMIDSDFLPYITIAARLYGKFGISAFGNDVRISSEIAKQRGLASSAACSTAFTKAVLNNSSAALPDDSIIDVARDGERVVHGNENAGKVDVPPSYYGGIVRISKDGVFPIESVDGLKLILIDTGPKKSTKETVGNVTRLIKSDEGAANALFDQIDECARRGIDSLMNNDMESLGACMYRNQELLEKLGVSSEGIEAAVGISRQTGILGAKLSGGGGGGIVVALPNGMVSGEFNRMIKENGFSVEDANIYHANNTKRASVGSAVIDRKQKSTT